LLPSLRRTKCIHCLHICIKKKVWESEIIKKNLNKFIYFILFPKFQLLLTGACALSWPWASDLWPTQWAKPLSSGASAPSWSPSSPSVWFSFRKRKVDHSMRFKRCSGVRFHFVKTTSRWSSTTPSTTWRTRSSARGTSWARRTRRRRSAKTLFPNLSFYCRSLDFSNLLHSLV